MTQKIREYDSYLFDADGTLFDTTDMIVRCFHYTAEVHKLPIPSRDAIISRVGMTLRAQMESYFGMLSDEQFSLYRETHMAYQMKIYREHLKLCRGVADALRCLTEHGKRCAVVTSRMLQTLSLYLNETGIARYFDVLITPESTTHHKPEPEPALEAVRQLGGVVGKTLFIGDTTFDIECGKRAGCATAFVLWSGTAVGDLTFTPDYCIADMRDVCLWQKGR
jgi:pyrophosphatase PpaX